MLLGKAVRIDLDHYVMEPGLVRERRERFRRVRGEQIDLALLDRHVVDAVLGDRVHDHTEFVDAERGGGVLAPELVHDLDARCVNAIDFPMIETDPASSVIKNKRNVPIDSTWDEARRDRYLRDLIRQMDEVHSPIVVAYQDTIILSRIHYGESEQRGIRGQASGEERAALHEEGIEVYPLPLPAALKGPAH